MRSPDHGQDDAVTACMMAYALAGKYPQAFTVRGVKHGKWGYFRLVSVPIKRKKDGTWCWGPARHGGMASDRTARHLAASDGHALSANTGIPFFESLDYHGAVSPEHAAVLITYLIQQQEKKLA